MSFRVQSAWLLGAVAVASLHCGAETTIDEDLDAVATDPNRVQVNDVSVMFPLPSKAGDEKTLLPASSKGAKGVLFPKAPYSTTFGFMEGDPDKPLHPGEDASHYYAKLKVVALRLDPCFAQIGPVVDDAKCDNQLRLIFQTIHDGIPGGAVDSAIHAFYRLTRDELASATKEIVALRIANGGTKKLGPLGVHPIVATQGLQGSMASGLNAIVLKYAGEKNLFRFTGFTPSSLATKWSFSGFDIASGKTTSMKIPTLAKGGDEEVAFFKGFGAGFSGGFSPPTTSKDNMQLFANAATAKAAPKSEQQAAYDAAIRIENPNFHSPNTIDCASCHVAGPARVLVGEDELKLSPSKASDVFSLSSKYVTKSDLKSSTKVTNETASNFHAFSYRDGQPMVSQRVVNETASVVAYVNEVVLAPPKP